MKKLDMLYIRACKSKNPIKRLRSLYRRFYFQIEKESDKMIFTTIMHNLLRIAEEAKIPKMSLELIEGLDPKRYYRYGGVDSDCYELMVSRVLCSLIRLTIVDLFPDVIWPGKYKK